VSDWTVEVTLGPDTFTQQRAPDADPTLPCLLSVEWSHELDLSEADAWPVPDEFTTATVVLLMERASDAAHYSPVMPCHLAFYTDDPATTPVDTFDGRGSFPVIDWHPLGVQVTITVVSYLLDLDAYLTGGGTMPAEQADARLNRELGFGLSGTWMDLAARDVGGISLLELARETLGYALVDVGVNPSLPASWEMYQLVQNVDAAGNLDPFFPWGIGEVPRRVFSSAPLQLRENPDDPGTFELWADPDDPATASLVIDADTVAQQLRLTRSIDRSINTVSVELADGTYATATNHQEAGEFVVATQRTGTQLATFAQALVLAEFLLPEGTDPSEWEADAFTVVLDATPADWYPQPLRSVMAVGNVPRQAHPDELTYLVGVVSRLNLAVASGSAQVTVTLDSRRVISDTPTALSIDEVPQDIDTVSGTIDSFIHAR
jgi:hypothetical protein